MCRRVLVWEWDLSIGTVSTLFLSLSFIVVVVSSESIIKRPKLLCSQINLSSFARTNVKENPEWSRETRLYVWLYLYLSVYVQHTQCWSIFESYENRIYVSTLEVLLYSTSGLSSETTTACILAQCFYLSVCFLFTVLSLLYTYISLPLQFLFFLLYNSLSILSRATHTLASGILPPFFIVTYYWQQIISREREIHSMACTSPVLCFFTVYPRKANTSPRMNSKC